MKPFRLKLIGTQWYYIPCRIIRVDRESWKLTKSNLSIKGKIYTTDCRKNITSIYDHTMIQKNGRAILRNVKPEDFEIEYL